MASKQISLSKQIKKVIGNRILFCSIALMIIIFGLTIYDLSISINQLRSRINEQIKPIEDFAINQAIINNLDTVNLKIELFNESSPTFKIEWIREGIPQYKTITWLFPFSWIYDYRIGDIAGYKFGYFKVTGNFLSDDTLFYDLMMRFSLLMIFTTSIVSLLFPLAKKIPNQLFINPINRFIDLISNNAVQHNVVIESLPVELEVLEKNILDLLRKATEHERNKAAIELGHLSARLAHDIASPLAAMDMSLQLLSKKLSVDDLTILSNGIQSVRDIANNVLERYRNPAVESNSLDTTIITHDDGNLIRPSLLYSLAEIIVSLKRQEWRQQPCQLTLKVKQDAKIGWIMASPNEIKRLLSNLLNNAYDALIDKNNGIINITIENMNNTLRLQIHDNGIGIPPEKITDALKGVSFKHHGKGLGLSGAKLYMENLGGKLDMHSIINKSTTINLIFPSIESITWVPKNIDLSGANVVIVLDDDFSMLTYWQKRIIDAGLLPKLFSTYDEASQWVQNNIELAKTAIFLVDYELTEATHNGLMFLQEAYYSTKRYLITSHAEKYHFQQEAQNAGIWLIPKILIGEIYFSL